MNAADIKRVFGILLVSMAALIALVNGTDPTKSVASILLVFFALYGVMACVAYLGIILVHIIALRINGGSRPVLRVSRVRAYYLSCALAFAPVCLLAMRSLDQLRALDLTLVGLLTLIVVFYIVKRT